MVLSPTATTAGGTTADTRGSAGRGQQAAPVAQVPFIRASQQHREPLGFDVSRQMTASDQDLGVVDVPAYGYMRSIVLLVTTSGGVAAAAPGFTENGPWNALKNIALTEPNGATLTSVTSGYSLYLINKYGGYRGYNDPAASPVFSKVNSAAPGFSYLVRIPVELSTRDTLGSLPNQNSGATFKVRLTLAKAADVFAGALTTAPTVRVRAYLEAWDQPEAATNGAPNQITPPAMNTTQFWTEQTFAVNAGASNTRLTRVGNYLRSLIFTNTRAGGSRLNGDADFPDQTTLYLDTRPLDIVERNNWKHQMYERFGYRGAAEAVDGLDNGVFVYDFMHEFDGTAGHENRDLWLPTLSSTRLELQGSFASAGNITVLTNDVAIAGSVFL